MAVSLSAWHTSLSAALGLVAVACGGQSQAQRPAGDDGGMGGGGTGGSMTGGSSGNRETGGTGSVTGGSSGTDSGGSSGTASGGSGAGGTSGTSGTSGNGGTAGMIVDAGMGGLDFSCKNGEPFTVDGSPTGLIRCEGNFVHRPERHDCPSTVPRDEVIFEPPDGGTSACVRDSDCNQQAYGFCYSYPAYVTGPLPGSACKYGCVRDEECAAGQVCACGDPVGSCVTANCTTDADCGDLLCTSSPQVDPCGLVLPGAFACQKREDLCRGLDDCHLDPTGPQSCMVTDVGRRCSTLGFCGRPFLVDGEARLAGVVFEDTGWASDVTPCLAGIDPTTRDELTAHYARLGSTEHASVAAFARFTLELMALGAPSELVLASQHALGDEVRHATTCFGFASAYAGRPLGPGALEMGWVPSTIRRSRGS